MCQHSVKIWLRCCGNRADTLLKYCRHFVVSCGKCVERGGGDGFVETTWHLCRCHWWLVKKVWNSKKVHNSNKSYENWIKGTKLEWKTRNWNKRNKTWRESQKLQWKYSKLQNETFFSVSRNNSKHFFRIFVIFSVSRNDRNSAKQNSALFRTVSYFSKLKKIRNCQPYMVLAACAGRGCTVTLSKSHDQQMLTSLA